jgi:sodium/potassium-transporting ATPase subunit alpha
MRMPPRKPVTKTSILSRKTKAMRRSKTLRGDAESGVRAPPSRLSQWLAAARRPFTREFWTDMFEKTEDERLVDSKVLSYAYLEAGMIEFAACITGYFVVFAKAGFSPSDLRRAQKSTGACGMEAR